MFFCTTNFNQKRLNETGLSNQELHILLRSADAELIEKVVDACSSGILLVKSDGSFLPTAKDGFKDLIQTASCLDSQNSLSGNPLSMFTEKFRTAALRKLAGLVYYNDVVSALRDEFLDNNSHAPHFVMQGTGREIFVEDAKRLDGLRAKLSVLSNGAVREENLASLVETPDKTLELLQNAETKFATKEIAKAFIADLFEGLTDAVSSTDVFSDVFNVEVVEQ